MITITQLEYLLAVASEMHFGRAAKSCFVSQPSLSAQIQKLEEELEVIIFDRSKRPLLITEVGKDIILQARTILKEHKKLNQIANLNKLVPKGEFQLGVIPTLASYVIPLFVGSFSKKYPKVKLTIHEHKTSDIVKLLNNDELDAGILVTPLDEDNIIERHLFYEPFYAYVSTDHALSKKRNLSESDLDISDLWLLHEGHCFRDQVLNICSSNKSKGKESALPNVHFESGSFETLKKLVRKNSGHTLLPELAVNDLSSKEKEKYVKKFKRPIPTREVSIVHARSFIQDQIIECLEETIIENIPKSLKSLKRKEIEVIEIY